jgi:hypothetical protein
MQEQTNNAIARAVLDASDALAGAMQGWPVEDKFVARATLITELAHQVGRDETPKTAVAMLIKQLDVYLEDFGPAKRSQILQEVANGLMRGGSMHA